MPLLCRPALSSAAASEWLYQIERTKQFFWMGMTQSRKSGAKVRFGKFECRVPGNKLQRTVLGIALCIGGVLGFLPVLGFWMLPLGIMILSLEYHPVRRLRRRFEVWLGRKRRKTPD